MWYKKIIFSLAMVFVIACHSYGADYTNIRMNVVGKIFVMEFRGFSYVIQFWEDYLDYGKPPTGEACFVSENLCYPWWSESEDVINLSGMRLRLIDTHLIPAGTSMIFEPLR